MRSEPVWLSLEDVLATNQEAVAATGENHFVRDSGLLESAIAKPLNHWAYGEDDIVVLAVKLLLGIAQNHPFEQGNKRTAFTAAATFLEMNGYELDAPDGEMFGKLIERVIIDDLSEGEFTEIIRACVNEIPESEDPAY